MYCPKCRAEYREGFTKCADCDVDLVEALPEGEDVEEYADMVTVFFAADEGIATLAESLLDGAGIRHAYKAKQDIFGRTTPLYGPVEIQVLPEDEAAARELLDQLDNDAAEDEEDLEDDGDGEEE